MRARWVSENPSPRFPVVGSATVAAFWPWKYYLVTTACMEGKEPLERLTRWLEVIKTGVPFDEVTVADYFRTMVSRCSRDMFHVSELVYVRDYPNLEEAKLGHDQVVRLLAQGRLKLPRPRRWLT
jgi:hypothetical protein